MENKIVVGYDGSEHARRALERAAAITGESGSVIVIAVSHVLAPLRGGGPGAVPVDAQEIAERRAALEEARAFLAAKGVHARIIEGTGDPADEIVAVADAEQAGLVVVGTRGRNLVERLLLGSVSTKVLQKAPCDVLVVR